MDVLSIAPSILFQGPRSGIICLALGPFEVEVTTTYLLLPFWNSQMSQTL